MDQNNLQAQIDALKARLDAFNSSPTIPYQVDTAWQNRGFVKTDFFVTGQGEIGSNGVYALPIPNSTQNSVVMAIPYINSPAAIDGALMTQGYANNNFGGATSQFDITNVGGDTFRYTWDGTGTDPNISATTLPAGSRIIILGTNFNPLNENAGSRPFFIVVSSGANYFEVSNSVGVAENDVTIGASGTISGGAPVGRPWEMWVTGTATATFTFIVFLTDGFYVRNPN